MGGAKSGGSAHLAHDAVGKTEKPYSASLTAAKSGTTAACKFTRGVALSNAGPLLGTKPPLPLNALAGLPVDQTLVLELDRTGIAKELKALFDVVLYLEYEATV